MEEEFRNSDEIISYWRNSAEQDFTTMQHLLQTKDYSWALFIGHLVLEKLLKAKYVKGTRKHALFTHDLLRLATKTNLIISAETEEWLDEISTFNLNARYDNYKQDFRKLCTAAFAEMWAERISKLRQWLISEL